MQQRPQQDHYIPMPPPAAYAAYQSRPATHEPLPVVRFPVQQYAPPLQDTRDADADVDDRETGNHHEASPVRLPVNGPSAPAIPATEDESDDKSTASPS